MKDGDLNDLGIINKYIYMFYIRDLKFTLVGYKPNNTYILLVSVK